MKNSISDDDKAMIAAAMAGDVPELLSFDWMEMAKWRGAKHGEPGILCVELCRKTDLAERRFAPFPPRLVLAVDNGMVLFDDGRKVPLERTAALVSRG